MNLIIIYIVVGVICGLVGGNWAQSKGQSPAVWGVLCGLFPIALVGLAMTNSEASGATSARVTERWRILAEVDSDVAAAALEARALGAQYEKRLAEKFLTLNDKQYLPALLAGMRTEASEDIASGKSGLISLSTPWGEVRYREDRGGAVEVMDGMLSGKSFSDVKALKRRLGIA